MNIPPFIAVGENIHCTRILKVGGKFVKAAGGGHVIAYTADGGARELPVSPAFVGNADWEAGKLKHCAVAIWQGNYGSADGKRAGAHYVQAMAREQADAGATYLDVNVDEFSTDADERARAMKWTVETVQAAVAVPISVDSSNVAILRAGLQACDKARGRPMVNSVSLERPAAVDAAREFNAVVIASAAGEAGLPSNTAERLANLDRIVSRLRDGGMEPEAIHADPLVFPISTDSGNGKAFLEAVAAVRQRYGKAMHIVAGLSNVSFGMPGRKLINQVFARLAVEAGADGGIVDPLQINARTIAELDTAGEPFRLARALLLGEDEFGMEFITAAREGRI